MTRRTKPSAAHPNALKSFEKFVCWEPSRVAQIMDTEALQPDPEVFLATHTSIPMFRNDLSETQGSTSMRSYEEGAMLGDFLASPEYAFVAVIGGAGTGKSHMVRWLSLKIPSTASRRVVLIPRAGTSLRKVLQKILDGVQGERFDDYRRR